VQDLPASQVTHKRESRDQTHPVTIKPNSVLGKIYGEDRGRVDVPTSHHQAVERLGAGLSSAAHADDGVVEAVELDGSRFVMGVQWHPERDFERNRSLFIEFVRQAARARALCQTR
jgi:putative glutamine amidotransferase